MQSIYSKLMIVVLYLLNPTLQCHRLSAWMSLWLSNHLPALRPWDSAPSLSSLCWQGACCISLCFYFVHLIVFLPGKETPYLLLCRFPSTLTDRSAWPASRSGVTPAPHHAVTEKPKPPSSGQGRLPQGCILSNSVLPKFPSWHR